MQGSLAYHTSGALIVLEHRFYGRSQPVPNSETRANNTDRFQYHTIAQALDDLVYFAENVQVVPGVVQGNDTAMIRPNETAWVFVGGSYSGGLANYLLQARPGVFWAAYSSSGVVEPIVYVTWYS